MVKRTNISTVPCIYLYYIHMYTEPIRKIEVYSMYTINTS